MKPIQLLYHGTSLDYSESIEENGLVKKNYDVVYLTADIEVAYEYALRAVKNSNSITRQPVICIIDAPQMVADGFTFNHELAYAEWTTECVPANYIVQVAIEDESDLDNIATNIYELRNL